MLKELFEIKKQLKESARINIAVDIDETLSDTITYWFEALSEKFGNPENLTPSELVLKYRYAQNVPYWQSPEAIEYRTELVYNNQLQTKFATMPLAVEYFNKLQEQLPAGLYLTNRPTEVIEGTKTWLTKNKLPVLPIITRPPFVLHNLGHLWKAEVLNFLAPELSVLIDDNYEILKYLPANYAGTIFLFNLKELPEAFKIFQDSFEVILCGDWKDVCSKLLNKYKK